MKLNRFIKLVGVVSSIGYAGRSYLGHVRTNAAKDALHKLNVVIPDQFVRCQDALYKYDVASHRGSELLFNDLLRDPKYGLEFPQYKPLEEKQWLDTREKHREMIKQAEDIYRSRKNLSPDQLSLFAPYSETVDKLLQCQQQLDQHRVFQEAINSRTGKLYEEHLATLHQGIRVGSNLRAAERCIPNPESMVDTDKIG